jgi:predicted peptidase
MNHRTFIKTLVSVAAIALTVPVFGGKSYVAKADQTTTPKYDTVTKGFDWGPGNSKIIIDLGKNVNSVPKNSFKVKATKDYTTPLNKKTKKVKQKTGTKSVDVLKNYTSDKDGNRVYKDSRYVALELKVDPDNKYTSPYNFNEKTEKNKNVGLRYNINQQKTIKSSDGNISNLKLKPKNLNKKLYPTTSMFKYGKFDYDNKKYGTQKLTYASYKPENTETKRPLIIFLHGLGEGTKDPQVPLLGNKVPNLASPKIQSYFGGAHVLVPQTSTLWMDSGNGKETKNGKNIYDQALLNLIKNYVKENSDTVDTSRIYVGGLSNGGYETIRLLMADPDYFAAGFPISEAYESDWLTNKQLKSIKDKPMWFVQSKDDNACAYKKTSKPVVSRLHKMGATDTTLTAYDHVRDISGTIKNKKGGPYQYQGHWSWIYVFNDAVQNEQGQSLFEWLAAQHN